MNYSLPKQFIVINEVPIIILSIEAFIKYNTNINVILTIPKEYKKITQELILKYFPNIDIQIVEGGETRYQSVKNALEHIPKNVIVGIHDAVRPFVSNNTIKNSFHTAQINNSAIPSIKPTDSIRIYNKNKTQIINRDNILLIQTPQVFNSTMIKEAYKYKFNEIFTDDASVFEYKYKDVTITEGNIENIKITTKHDIFVAEALCKNLSNNNNFPQININKKTLL